MKNTNYYLKPNVSLHEYHMHKMVYDLNIVNIPEIISYKNGVMKMRKINNMCMSDFYGEKNDNISCELFEKIRNIIKKLYDNNIIYPDITGYNFIEDPYNKEKIWIIDFEHSHFVFDKPIDNFVNDFILGRNSWNENFE